MTPTIVARSVRLDIKHAFVLLAIDYLLPRLALFDCLKHAARSTIDRKHVVLCLFVVVYFVCLFGSVCLVFVVAYFLYLCQSQPTFTVRTSIKHAKMVVQL